MTEKYKEGNQPNDIRLENEPELSSEELEKNLRPLFGEYLEAVSTSPLFREVLANIWKRSGDWQTVEIKTENFYYFISRRCRDLSGLWLTKHTFKDGKRVLDESVTLKTRDEDFGRSSIQYSSAVQPIAENRDKIIILTRSQSAVEQAKAFLERIKTDLLTPKKN